MDVSKNILYSSQIFYFRSMAVGSVVSMTRRTQIVCGMILYFSTYQYYVYFYFSFMLVALVAVLLIPYKVRHTHTEFLKWVSLTDTTLYGWHTAKHNCKKRDGTQVGGGFLSQRWVQGCQFDFVFTRMLPQITWSTVENQ